MESVVHQDRHILVVKLVECHYQRHESCVFESQQQSISKTFMHTTVRFDQHVHCIAYRMAGNFRGVLIFVIFVVDSAVTKISTHEN